MQQDVTPNKGKNLTVTVDGTSYSRIPIKTHVITVADKLEDIFGTYVVPLYEEGDISFISEKAVACTQNRAIPMKDIHPSWLARTLCKFVYKSPYGIGLSIPETMEMAIRECGVFRILLAAVVSAFGKLIGKRGWFYQIVGDKARAIDGPCDCTIPPYNEYVVLGPVDPEKVAMEMGEKLGIKIAIVDINDLGANILGVSHASISKEWLVEILRDNPLGQGDEQTPIGIIRPIKSVQ